MIRAVPPVAAPIPFRGLLAGLGALFREPAGAREALSEWLARRHGARAVLLTDSGTTALTLALRAALAAGHGLVALPAYACYDLATALVGAGEGARCVFYDLDPATLSPDLDSLRRAVGLGASVVVIVHLYGMPVDIAALGLPAGIVVVDDAAQGVGARMHGRHVGGGGSLGVLSFGRGKGMTGGGGGALLANDERGVRLLESKRADVEDYGSGLASWVGLVGQWVLGRPSLYRLALAMPFLHLGETRYRTPHAPSGLTSPAAAILRCTTALADADTEVRRRNAEWIHDALRGTASVELIRVVPGAEPGYLRLPVLIEPRHADVGRGIQPGYPASLPELPVLRDRGASREAGFPGARQLVSELLTFPTHHYLKEKDLQALSGAMGGGG